jgi:hypothetical protein
VIMEMFTYPVDLVGTMHWRTNIDCEQALFFSWSFFSLNVRRGSISSFYSNETLAASRNGACFCLTFMPIWSSNNDLTRKGTCMCSYIYSINKQRGNYLVCESCIFSSSIGISFFFLEASHRCRLRIIL